jgi:hypothetical protein
MSKQIVITLTNGQSDYDLNFRLLDYSIAQRWLKHLELFIQAGQPWDDPKRFYNFPNTAYPEPVVAQHLRHLLSIIKDYAPDIVDREIGDTITQDDLNYFHHIFEVYHGLYDTQDQNEFFKNAPVQVQDALGDLNIWIHRYETLGSTARFVATWKYKPYRDDMEEEDFKLFSLKEDWGDLLLNYCEIGKTLYDFWHDNDAYIAPDAFKPLRNFCFDFTVRFNEKTNQEWADIEQKVWNYFDQNQEFFHQQGYKKYDPKLSLGSIAIGKIITDEPKHVVIEKISQHQCLKNIRAI